MKRLFGAWRDTYGLAVVFFFALAVAALNDATVGRMAADAPRGLIELGRFVSLFGLSGYMLVLAAAIVVAAMVAPRRGIIRVFGLSPTDLGERAAYVFVTIAGSGLICQAIKHTIGRARPRLLTDLGAFAFNGPGWRSGMESFPSGHTTTVFAAAYTLSCFYPAGRPAFYAAAVLVGLARILAGNHYPSDVIAGAILGTLSAGWFMRIFAARNIAFSFKDAGIGLKPAPGRPWGMLA